MPSMRIRAGGRALVVSALLAGLGAGPAGAQRPQPLEGTPIVRSTAKLLPLSAPRVKVDATPVAVTVAWGLVDGASTYSVEQASSLGGPWTSLRIPRGATTVTAPTSAGFGNGYGGGTLYYYRVSALASAGEPGVTVIPRVTPPIDRPVSVEIREEGADAWVYWTPVPYATSYVVSAALGSQTVPSQVVEVGAQYTETRLVNVALPYAPQLVSVKVSARYGTGGPLSVGPAKQFSVPALQACWPPASDPGLPPHVPQVTVASGPTFVSLVSGDAIKSGVANRVERAPIGSAGPWQTIGCRAGHVLDASLVAGAQYQYRLTEIGPLGAVGQTTVVATTSPILDNQTPTATLSGCSVAGCQVTLNWNDYAGTQGVQIQSSYGLSQVYATNWFGKLWNGPTTGGSNAVAIQPSFSVPLPKGVYTFWLTTLFPPMRPTTRPPGQVTVVVQ